MNSFYLWKKIEEKDCAWAAKKKKHRLGWPVMMASKEWVVEFKGIFSRNTRSFWDAQLIQGCYKVRRHEILLFIQLLVGFSLFFLARQPGTTLDGNM